MTFEAWLGRLRNDGYLLCPASTAVPVELRAVRPDGWGLHLRCRGVQVRLGLYRPGRSAWQVPLRDREVVPEEALELWEHRPLRHVAEPGAGPGATLPTGTRIVFTGSQDLPDHQLVFDGSREHGWRGHEAGLLRAGAAAEIFTALLAAAEPELDRWRPSAPTLGGLRPVPASGSDAPARVSTGVPSARVAPLRPAVAAGAEQTHT
ncbi:hypothetical protein [Pseudofrankia sp. DC12]|uniref:hypothetical protein n=1 Tax=Pseudofrankia sp. DC12 TaxID=683315 RepID=UPI0005F8831A|nr:hypothetical protein [Pseudofrankia sp. DC12]